MSASEFLSQPHFQAIGVSLIHFIWQGCLIGAVVRLLMSIPCRQTPQRRYWLGLLGLASMMICPFATYGVYCSMDDKRVSEVAKEQADDSTLLELNHPAVARPNGLLDSGSKAADGGARGRTLSPYSYIAAGWLIGVLFFTGRLGVGIAGVSWMKRTLRPTPAALSARFTEMGKRLGVRADKIVYLSQRVEEAVVVGLFRPMILLPASWVMSMSPEMLEAVVAHELAHIQRRDMLINMVQRIVETILFYHPVVWWVSRLVRQEREKCCDAQAVAATGRRLVYVQVLEFVASRRASARGAPLAAAIGGEKNMNLLHRVRYILGLSMKENVSSRWPAAAVIAVAATLLLLWTPVWFTSAQERERETEKKDQQSEANSKEGIKKRIIRIQRSRRDQPEKAEREETEKRERRIRLRRRREDDEQPVRQRQRIRLRRDDDREEVEEIILQRRDDERRQDETRRRDERRLHDQHRRRDERSRRDQGFRPGGPGSNFNPRELVRLIEQLRAEVAELRREVRQMRGDRRGPERRDGASERRFDERNRRLDERRVEPPRERRELRLHLRDPDERRRGLRREARPIPPRERLRLRDRPVPPIERRLRERPLDGEKPRPPRRERDEGPKVRDEDREDDSPGEEQSKRPQSQSPSDNDDSSIVTSTGSGSAK